jgi:four helix bundle protein
MDSYRSLQAWKHAHSAALLAHQVTETLTRPKHWAALDQLRRAAISVEANIVEGYALGTVPQCRRHLWIAFGSAAEAECLVRLVKELGYLDEAVANELETSLGGAMRTLRGLIRNPPRNPTHHAPRTTHAPTHHAPRTTHA